MEDDCQFDSFGTHVNKAFSTRDQDHDSRSDQNYVNYHCAELFEGMFRSDNSETNTYVTFSKSYDIR